MHNLGIMIYGTHVTTHVMKSSERVSEPYTTFSVDSSFPEGLRNVSLR